MRATFTVNTNKFNVTATPFVKTFRVTASSVGRKGDKGDTGVLTTINLTVDTNGQTMFNISTIPLQAFLTIDGVEYYQNIHFTIGMVNSNATLTWLNKFQLETTDTLILKRS